MLHGGLTIKNHPPSLSVSHIWSHSSLLRKSCVSERSMSNSCNCNRIFPASSSFFKKVLTSDCRRFPSKQIENLYQHWLCRWPVWHATPAGMGWLPIMSRANNFFVFDGGMVAITALDPALMNSITFAIASACIVTKAQLTIVWCPPCQLQTN